MALKSWFIGTNNPSLPDCCTASREIDRKIGWRHKDSHDATKRQRSGSSSQGGSSQDLIHKSFRQGYMFNKEWGLQSFLRWTSRSQCAPAIVTWHRLLPASSCLFIVWCGISPIFEGFRNYNEIYVVSNRRIFAMCNHCGCQLHQSHDIQGEASNLLPPFGRGSDYLWNQTVQTAPEICGFRTNLTIPTFLVMGHVAF